ncbi:MAG: isochorismatase family protein [Jatrophihabitans sp.]|nr:MAG: isochorismatase family protein [Jatrophihabitans sp.]
MSTAVIVVDVQNDFCDVGVPAADGGIDGGMAGGGGSLAVAGGSAVAAAISARLAAGGFDHAVATRDHHVDPGAHFADRPDFATTWPAHCVVGTPGVELHASLDRTAIEAVFDKGEYAAAYSGFEGRCDGEALGDWLRDHGVDAVEVVGIATDHCVRATALDAAREGFATTVRLDLTAGVARATVEAALAELAAAGVRLVGTPVVGG